jgi:hypothetical protein
MTSGHPEGGHGNTVAAWTMVAIMIIGSIVSAVGMWIASPAVFWAGAVVIVIGGIVGKVLQVMGHGQVKATA